MCCIDDGGQELERKWRRANKQHACYACRAEILAGDKYHVVVQITGAGKAAFKRWARCWMICEALWEAGAEGVQWDLDCGDLWEDVFEDPPFHVAQLAFLSREEGQELARIATLKFS